MKFFNFREIKNNLTRSGDKEPLNWFSIFILIALDIFIVINLFQALNVQANQITKAYEKYPYQCKEIFSSNFEKDNLKFSTIKRINEGQINFGNEFQLFNLSSSDISLKTNVSEKCLKLNELAKEIWTDKEIGSLISEIKKLERNILIEKDEERKIRDDYNTNLLEKIAGQKKENSITENDAWESKDKISSLRENIYKWEIEIENIRLKILSEYKVQNFFEYVNNNKKEVLDDYKSLEFWYPVKVWFFKLIFLVPLFLIFWFLYRKASQKGSNILTLIYSHALVITTIPIFWGILEFLYSIVPKKFLIQFLDFLRALNLEILIFPLMIFGGILVALLLIYIIQRKLFNKKKIQLKRISEKKCTACGINISEEDYYCYNCGEEQYIKCRYCNGFAKKEGLYCTNCGKKDFKVEKE